MMRSAWHVMTMSVVLIPVSAGAGLVDMAGADDYFANGPDPANPSADLLSALSVYDGTQDFDLIAGEPGASSNRQVVHTFRGMPLRMTGATLEFRVRAGNNHGVGNDGVFLSFTDAEAEGFLESVVYRRSFGAIPAIWPSYPEPDPGLVGVWDRGTEAFVTLDLAALPQPDGTTFNLIPLMKANNYLDACVSDETGVDFFRLTFEIGGPVGPIAAAEVSGPRLLGNSPNPFRRSTDVHFSLQHSADALVRVFDVSGRLVRTVHQGSLPAGEHFVAWDGRNERGASVNAGVYFYRLESPGFAETRKMILVR